MVATTPATELRKRESGKLCLKGFCPCKQKVGKTGARLSAIPDKRKVQLRDQFWLGAPGPPTIV